MSDSVHVPCVCVVCTIVAVESIMTNFQISVGEKVGEGGGTLLGTENIALVKECLHNIQWEKIRLPTSEGTQKLRPVGY